MENSCDLLIMNATVVIPKVGIMDDANIMIEGGKIKSLTRSANSTSASKKIDARGKYVLPGAIDPHVHYGVYTPVNDAARTESRSAAVGGVTTMIRMLRLFDRYSHNGITDQLQASRGNHYIDYSIHASILRPDQIGDISYLREIGINSFKIYMNLGADLNRIHMDLAPGSYTVKDGLVDMTDELMSLIVGQAANVHSTILVHAENPQICSQHIQIAKQKRMSHLEAWSYARPPYSEAQSISKISHVGRSVGSASLYFVHIGSTAAVDAVIAEREKGLCNYYLETCPHYLTHTTEFGNLIGKVSPPIRSKSDVQSTWSALRNGIIDTVGTDHVASRLHMKMGDGDVWSALSGFPGVATMIPVLLSEGVNENRINLERVAEVTSYNTARIFNMYPKKGTIQPGSDADLTIVDLDLEKTVTPDILQSYSDYTIYDGWKLRGWPIMTIVRGKVIMENGDVASEALGHGEFIPRPVAIT
ncbi:MAG TPA: amidohydrolase family protein [Nitrososphaera sp.]|jgi:dihydropyrimidinase|nr:amidohydrolase family protein [Nitrososphaera sp.]